MKFWIPYFNTKKALIERIREILHTHPIGDPLSPDDAELMHYVFSRHPNYEEKQNGQMDFVTVGTHYYMGKQQKHFSIRRKDGSEVDISYIVATAPKPYAANADQDARTAARFEINDQIKAKRITKGASDPCSICGEQIEGDVHIHHDPSFKALFDGFLEQYKVPHMEVEEHEAVYLRFKDRYAAKQWQDYHKEHAKLFYSHAKCNMVAGSV